MPYNELSPRMAVLSKFFVALTISSKLNCLHTGKSSAPIFDVSEMYPIHKITKPNINCKSNLFHNILRIRGLCGKTSLLAFESISEENLIG